MPRTYGTTNATPYASAPAVGTQGDTYWNTTEKSQYLSDGNAWLKQTVIPAGGAVGDVLLKNSIADYDALWGPPPVPVSLWADDGIALKPSPSRNVMVEGASPILELRSTVVDPYFRVTWLVKNDYANDVLTFTYNRVDSPGPIVAAQMSQSLTTLYGSGLMLKKSEDTSVSATGGRISMQACATAGSNIIGGRTYGGLNFAANAATPINATFIDLTASGLATASFKSDKARIRLRADENWVVGATGTRIDFSTCTIGSETVGISMHLHGSDTKAFLGIGTLNTEILDESLKLANGMILGAARQATPVAGTMQWKAAPGGGQPARLEVHDGTVWAPQVEYPSAYVTANTTLTRAQQNVGVDAAAGSITITMPDASTCVGREYVIQKIDTSTNQVLITPTSSAIDGQTTQWSLLAQWDKVAIRAVQVTATPTYGWINVSPGAWSPQARLIGLATQTNTNLILFQSFRGTRAAYASTQTGDVIGQFMFQGCVGANPTLSSTIYCKATEVWQNLPPTAAGSDVYIKTRAAGGASAADAALFKGGGDFQIFGANATKSAGTAWINPSDIRIKKNITDYASGLEQILALQPKTFEFNGLAGTKDGHVGYGFIADDVASVMPEMVGTQRMKLHPENEDEEETEIQTLDTSNLTLALVNAVKQLAARVAVLEA